MAKLQYFASPEEALATFKELCTRLRDNFPDLTAKVKKLDMIIAFDYSQDAPDAILWWDARGGKFDVGTGKPPAEPKAVMSLSIDDAHRSWSNKLNPVTAITRRKIKVKGSVAGLLKLAPNLLKVAKVYKEVLKDRGHADIIL